MSPIFVNILLLFIVWFTTNVADRQTQRMRAAQKLMQKYDENRRMRDQIKHKYKYIYPVRLVEPTGVDKTPQRYGIDTRNYYFNNGSIHHNVVGFLLRSRLFPETLQQLFPTTRIKIRLRKNKMLIQPDAWYGMTSNGNDKELVINSTRGSLISDCFYQGYVKLKRRVGIPIEKTFVALTTCDGLRGVVHINGTTFVILPLVGGNLNKKHPHILYVSRSLSNEQDLCWFSESHEWGLRSGGGVGHSRRKSISVPHSIGTVGDTFGHRENFRSRHKRDVRVVSKFIELAVVVDWKLTEQLRHNLTAIYMHVLAAINLADLVYNKDLGTRISVVSINAFTKSVVQQSNNDADRFEMNVDLGKTLSFFRDYLVKSDLRVSRDATIFISSNSRETKANSVGMAMSSTMCTQHGVSIVKDKAIYEEFQLGLATAHLLTHNLGIGHDRYPLSFDVGSRNDESCKCDAKYCLMQETFVDRFGEFPFKFSSCSMESFFDALSEGKGHCMFNLPMQYSDNKCGNKVIDLGEQCDCGSIKECDDSCCDPVTCHLRQGAECAAGACCDQCKLRAKNTKCRNIADECDVTEFCDGVSGVCPRNAYMINGIECSNNRGYCYEGECRTIAKQCRKLLGNGATVANDKCFQENTEGKETGHCGVTEEGVFTHCTAHNIMCGLIQCQGGSDGQLSNEFKVTKTISTDKTSKLVCKVAIMPFERSATVLASDGVKCGLHKVCINHKCVAIAGVTAKPNCPTNNMAYQCSDHGVCTNLNTCYCYSQWVGNDCSRRISTINTDRIDIVDEPSDEINGTIINSANGFGIFDGFPNDLNTYSMLVILGGVGLVVLLILLCLIFCYRRESASLFRNKNKLLALQNSNGVIVSFAKSDVDGSESSFDTAAQRSIKFGNMPSYRDEKMQQKKQKNRNHNKSNQRLQNIKEVSAEEQLERIALNPDDVRQEPYGSSDDHGTSDDIFGDHCLMQNANLNRPCLVPPLMCSPINSSTSRGILKNYGRNSSDNESNEPLLYTHHVISPVTTPITYVSSPHFSSARSAILSSANHSDRLPLYGKTSSPHPHDGYESDCLYGDENNCKIFGQSLKQLNECDIVYRQTSSSQSFNKSSDNASYANQPVIGGNSEESTFVPGLMALSNNQMNNLRNAPIYGYHQQQPSHSTNSFSGTSPPEKLIPMTTTTLDHLTNPYAASRGVGYGSGFMQMPTSARSSSARPIANGRSTNMTSLPRLNMTETMQNDVIGPPPLELENIQYLLQQIDAKNQEIEQLNAGLLPPSHSTSGTSGGNGISMMNGHHHQDSVSPCSSAELSVPEADKHEILERGSNTESQEGGMTPAMLYPPNSTITYSAFTKPNMFSSSNANRMQQLDTMNNGLYDGLHYHSDHSPSDELNVDGHFNSFNTGPGEALLAQSFNSSTAETVIANDDDRIGQRSVVSSLGSPQRKE